MSDLKKRILARRAAFVAAAVASIGTAACSETEPQVCLEPMIDGGGEDTRPQACLTPEIDSSTDGDASDATDASDTSVGDTSDTGPMPCLIPPEDTGS